MSEIEPNLTPSPNSNLFPNFEEAEHLIDDSRMNETIKNLLKTFPDSCWGGSSVLYDIVLPFTHPPPNKSWDTRDFDVYCLDKDYIKISSFMKTCPMVYLSRIFPTMRKLSYANLDIKGLTEYIIKLKDGIVRKIQLVNIGNQSNYSNLYKAVDLSFCSVVVSNNMVYYLRTTKLDILEKRGRLLTFPCMCSSCSKNDGIRLNYKITNRIKKYRARGFKIDMVCQFCDYSLNTIQHTQLCLCRTLVNKKINSLGSILHGHDDSKFENDEINRLISYSHQYKNDSVILLSIYLIFCYFKRIDLLHSFWEEIKLFVDIRVVMECSKQLVKSGLYTGFRLLFEYLFPCNINLVNSDERGEYIYSIMETVVNSNYIQSALLIQSRIPTIKLSIYEDKIFSWKNRVVYEMLFELINAEDSSQDEIDSLMKTIPFVEKLEANDPAIQTICPTCKYDDCSMKMICGHSFCQNCLIFNLMDIYEKSKKEMCPCCRTEYHYLTKRVCNA